MSAPERAALLAVLAACLLGCDAVRLIGRDCPPGGCDRAAPGDAAVAACGVTFVLPEQTWLAGAEIFRCQLFTLDALRAATGSDRAYLTGAVATMTPYSHELDVFVAPEHAQLAELADGPVDCDALLDRPIAWVPLIESLGGSDAWEFSSAPLVTQRSQRLLIREHFANLTGAPIAAGVSLALECANSLPKRPSQVFEFVDTSAHIVAPGEQVTAGASCSFDRDVDVWRLYRPTQRIISGFEAWRGDPARLLWQSGPEWSYPLSPPLRLVAGDGFGWKCVYQNQGTVSFELGGSSGYTCSLMGIYQLAHDGEDLDPIRCTH